MKKALSFVLVFVLLVSVCSVAAFADSKLDIEKLKDDELLALYAELRKEIIDRGLKLPDEITLREGKYIVGEDILPGTYKITCTETFGEQYSDMTSALGGMTSALGEDSIGSMLGSLGGMMEAVANTTVEIIGDYGTVLKEFELKSGESTTIKLDEKTAIQITLGSCTLVPLE